ncbi:VCBS repeat-containing protein [Coraliomargarita sp. SDUM461004]|uniref:VCBS repeat-containing protein n=1 Tax=Thalassobacterium sedimentorum TaxID=3041258 RepID=A0ABU1ADV4_9BACT|nr:VCBS repeat-containing protein [Coraliomargarita sp. SDUM461004]MDQ8192911.1 VCBS repeat-containing protein [Coraliomargarita sp. SDUM461004]
MLYTPVAKDGKNNFWSLPADYPIYDVGVQFDGLKGSRYIPITRNDGIYDLIRPSDWMYLSQSGTPESPQFQDSYKIEFDGPVPKGKEWIADVDGDSIPDLLIGAKEPAESQFQMYPNHEEYGHPWSGILNPNLGMLPDSDIQNFRGYDIAGNWLGSPITRYLWWAKGRFEDSRLTFGQFSKVRYGSTDYELQWRSYGFDLHPVVIELQDGPIIVLFTDNDKAMGMPIKEIKNGYLHVGKARPLLKDAATLKSAVHPNVIGIADLNSDGQDDIVIGSGANGRLTVLSGGEIGEFVELGNIFHTGGEVSADTLAVPARQDWNQDGYPDLIIGDGSGVLSLRLGTTDSTIYDNYVNFKTASGYIRHRPVDGNLQGDNETAWSYTQPEVFDWDGDGNLDIITNDNEAKLFYYQGTGTSNLVKERQRLMLGNKPLPTAWRTRPAVIDGKYGIAGDTRNTLLMIQWNSDFGIAIPDAPGSLNFERIIPLKDITGETINLSGPGGNSGRIKLSVADWDQDGDWDIVFSSQKSLQKFFRLNGNESPTAAAFWMSNEGTNEAPVFNLPQMITFADGTPIAINKHNFNVYPTDLNEDGALDIIFGDDEGFLFYLYRKDLAWNEDVTAEKELRISLNKAKKNTGNFKSGDTIASDDWSNNRSNDPFWAVNSWLHTQDNIFRTTNGKMQLRGNPPRVSETKRYLATPIDFNPEAPIKLHYATTFRRIDSRNAGGNEFLEIINLRSSINGRPLAAVGFNSSEELEIKSLGEKHTVSNAKIRLNKEYTIDVELALKPSGTKDVISVVVSENNGLERNELPRGRLETEIHGVADLLEIEIGKNAGRLELGPFTLRAK